MMQSVAELQSNEFMNVEDYKKILLVEDNLVTAEWVKEILRGIFVDAEITHCETVKKSLNVLGDGEYNLAVVDIQLPDGTGIDIIRSIRQKHEKTQVIVATIFDDDRHIFESLKAGAHGYLLKDESREKMESQIQGVVKGEPALSPSIARKVVNFFHSQRTQSPKEHLTNREQEVLVLIAKGLTRKEISKHLTISEHTTAGYIKNIYRKLNINSRAEAALEAGRRGLVM